MSWFIIVVAVVVMLLWLMFERAKRESEEPAKRAPPQPVVAAPRPRVGFDPFDPEVKRALGERAQRFQTGRFEDVIEAADAALRNYGAASSVALGFDGASITWIADYCERQHRHGKLFGARLVVLATELGPLLGSAMRETGCGEWWWDKEGQTWMLRQSPTQADDPFELLTAHLSKGGAAGAGIAEAVEQARRAAVDALPARLRAAAQEADAMTWTLKERRETLANSHILDGVLFTAPPATLRAAFGAPLSYAGLTRMISPYRLRTMLQMCQAGMESTLQILDDPHRARGKQLYLGRLKALMGALLDDGVIRLVPVTVDGKLRQRVEFPDAPTVAGCLQIRKAASERQHVQFRLEGETEVRVGRVVHCHDKESMVVHDDPSGQRWMIPYHAVVMDGAEPAHELIDAVLLAHVADEEPLTTMTVNAFDDVGQPELRLMRDGSMEIVFNAMPPTWATDPAEFDDMDVQLQRALGAPVEWIDREVFRVASPNPALPFRAWEFLDNRRVRMYGVPHTPVGYVFHDV